MRACLVFVRLHDNLKSIKRTDRKICRAKGNTPKTTSIKFLFNLDKNCMRNMQKVFLANQAEFELHN